MSSSSWMLTGDLHSRTDFPPWFHNISLWINTGWNYGMLNCSEGDPDLVYERVSTLVKTLDLKDVGLHWYCWHKNNFDTSNISKM
jgi:hypothetical protein